jgi:hypothetical protein
MKTAIESIYQEIQELSKTRSMFHNLNGGTIGIAFLALPIRSGISTMGE